MSYKPELAETLRTLRKSKKMTQEELAEAAGLCPSGIASYEQGRSKPRWDTIVKLANALGCVEGQLDPMHEFSLGEGEGNYVINRPLAELEERARDGVQILAEVAALLRTINDRCESGDCPLLKNQTPGQ